MKLIAYMLSAILSSLWHSAMAYIPYDALVIALMVRKIPKIIFLLSCTSYRQDLRRLKKNYLLEVQLAYLVNFAQLLLRFSRYFSFSAPQISLTLLLVTFSRIRHNFLKRKDALSRFKDVKLKCNANDVLHECLLFTNIETSCWTIQNME